MEQTEFSALQQPVDRLAERSWDVVVIGAGPAGSVAAGAVAREGLRTLLIDREPFPRQKTCGDGLNLDALRVLRQLGLADDVERDGRCLERARVTGAGSVEVTVEGPFVTLERRVLDARLARWAVDLGATFAVGQVRRVGIPDRIERYHVEVEAPSATSLDARFVLVATGADTALAETLGLADRRPPSAAATRFYVRSSVDVDALIGVYAPSTFPGYGWVFPLPDGLYNVGVITFYRRGRLRGEPLRRRLERFCEEVPLAHDILRHGEIVQSRRAAPLRCGLPDPARAGRAGLLALGEAIGTTLPLTGEGVGKAMESGRMAAEAVLEAAREDWPVRAGAAYVSRLETLTSRYSVYALGEHALGRPRLNRWLARQARRRQGLRHALEAVIVRESGLADVLSISGMGKLLSS
jgi:geranylgeranyl reductase family protein